MKKEITINRIRFSTQQEAINYTREVLLKLEPIREIQPANEEWNYLIALIKRHPRYEVKNGKGINSITIKRNGKNIAIHLNRIDGTIADISWIKCIKAKTASPEEKLISAMRVAVQGQIHQFKDNAKQAPLVCGICADPIPSPDDMHVHHDPPFAELAATFITENSPPPTQFDDDLTTREAKFNAESQTYSKHWQDYHHKHAKLMATHDKCNLTQPKKTL